MSVIEHLEPTQAMIDAAAGHVEAARRTTMHASHHARAALIDAAAADDRPKGAVDLLEQAVSLIAQPTIPNVARKRWQAAVDDLLGDGNARAAGRG